MRITSKTGTGSVSSTRAVGGTSPTGPAAPTAPVASISDALNVSGTAQFMTVATAYLAKVPDIRHAKVEALRSQMASQSYNPDGEAVADGIVREHTPPARNP